MVQYLAGVQAILGSIPVPEKNKKMQHIYIIEISFSLQRATGQDGGRGVETSF